MFLLCAALKFKDEKDKADWKKQRKQTLYKLNAMLRYDVQSGHHLSMPISIFKLYVSRPQYMMFSRATFTYHLKREMARQANLKWWQRPFFWIVTKFQLFVSKHF